MNKNSLNQWVKEIREVATESRRPGADVKSLNVYLNAAGKNLSYLKFEASLNKISKKTKKK